MSVLLPKVSIIIRTKNEERWISPCLRGVFNQTYKNIEVILVDNNSDDQTIRRAKEYPVKIIEINDFLPGKAINEGIRASSGDIIVCLSGHCIPVGTDWLSKLVEGLNDPLVAGVYGRQEPLSYTSDADKRDLITVFGLDKKIQIKDYFFHNANSAFRRDIWNKFPFDEEVTNVEDRVWGKQVIQSNYRLIYEPEASVYHWHGINHDGNPDRARNVVRILESIQDNPNKRVHQEPAEMKIVAIIPSRGKSIAFNGSSLLEHAIHSAGNNKFIKKIYVATDSAEMADIAKSLGASVPCLRPAELSHDYIDVAEALAYVMREIEVSDDIPDLVVIIEETYPFRAPMILDQMIERLLDDGLDTVMAGKRETRGIWIEQNGNLDLLGEGFMPRALKKENAIIGLAGFGCVTFPEFIRSGTLRGGRLGIFEVSDPYAAIEVRDEVMRYKAEKIYDTWSKPIYDAT